jgi:hypothetical protein
MKVVQFVLGLVMFFQFYGPQLLWAGELPPKAQKVEDACRMVLEQNFNAVTSENWKQLQSTLSKQVGTPEQVQELKEEAEKMFADTDVYIRLSDFRLTGIQMPMAEGVVLQMTLPADEKDREPVLHQRLGVNFRHYSALLPEYEMVAYRQMFRYEGGKWKVHQISSEPEPAEMTTFPARAAQPDCANGQCAPFIKVR